MLQTVFGRCAKILQFPSILDEKGQTTTEYIIIVSIGIILAVIAAATLLYMMENVGVEISLLKEYEEHVMEVLLS